MIINSLFPFCSCCTGNNNHTQICLLQPLICNLFFFACFNNGGHRAPCAVSWELPDVFLSRTRTFLAEYVPNSGFCHQKRRWNESLASEYHFSHKCALYPHCRDITWRHPAVAFIRLFCTTEVTAQRWPISLTGSLILGSRSHFLLHLDERVSGWPLCVCLTRTPAEVGLACFHQAVSPNCRDLIHWEKNLLKYEHVLMNIQRQLIINERMLRDATPGTWEGPVSSHSGTWGTPLLLQWPEPSGARKLTRNVQDVHKSTPGVPFTVVRDRCQGTWRGQRMDKNPVLWIWSGKVGGLWRAKKGLKIMKKEGCTLPLTLLHTPKHIQVTPYSLSPWWTLDV